MFSYDIDLLKLVNSNHNIRKVSAFCLNLCVKIANICVFLYISVCGIEFACIG